VKGLRRAGNRTLVTCAALSLAGLLPAAEPSHRSQQKGNYFTVKPPGSVDYVISEKPSILAAQVALALQREKAALQLLTSGSSDLSQAKPAMDLVKDGYVLLRTATHGLQGLIESKKYPSPLWKMRQDKIMTVRWKLLDISLNLDNALHWQDETYLAPATESLTEAVRLLEELLPQML